MRKSLIHDLKMHFIHFENQKFRENVLNLHLSHTLAFTSDAFLDKEEKANSVLGLEYDLWLYNCRGSVAMDKSGKK